ncbi:MAG TPA: putative peptidoglycan glycosyltransferase FtsW [Solirubrobacteraceae bacterium]|nr:putative peptidoglycan glycosyltransferase FtsW [Solirubrobacteraceae bacterium]
MPPRPAQGRTTRRVAPPLEHRILLTATLCLIAFGAVMVYSASSPEGAINGGYGTGEFLMYLFAAGLGLIAMWLGVQFGLGWLTPQLTRAILYGSTALLLLVLVPGIGRDILGARRWFAAGPIQFQPSELAKFALVLYTARYLADNPRRLHRGFKPAIAPIAVALGPACVLIAVEPDLGTTLVCFLTIVSMLVVAGVPGGYLTKIFMIAGCGLVLMVLVHPYEATRLTSFLHPFSAKSSAGWQSAQSQYAVGSGGIFGDGLGQSVAKDAWLPEAQTDFILAVIGEELGLVGILLVISLYGMIAYAGMRTARRAATRYTKLLASGLTSLILCQGLLNIFVVLGIAPLTGVPLPFISYAPTNLIVMLGSIGLLLGIARPAARELRLVDGHAQRHTSAAGNDGSSDTDRDRRHRRARGSGAGRSRRAAS